MSVVVSSVTRVEVMEDVRVMEVGGKVIVCEWQPGLVPAKEVGGNVVL